MSTEPMEIPQTVTNEAERAVLGAVLLGGAVAPAVEEGVRDDDFYYENHRLIFAVMCAMHRDGESLDVLTLTDRLGREGLLSRVGGRCEVDLLASSVPYVGNLRPYAQIVVRAAMWRERRRILQEAYTAAQNEDEDLFRRWLGGLRESELHFRPLVSRADPMTP